MANSVDPDPGAIWSGSVVFAYAILSETLVYETFVITSHIYREVESNDAGNLNIFILQVTLERRYYLDPYNAETVITRLVCGSHFLCSFFPNFGSFALFPQNSAVKKFVSHDRTLVD